MRNSYLFLFALVLLPTTLWAQAEDVDPFVQNITDVLAQKKLQTSKAEARALSQLEDQNNQSSCIEDIKTQESCQGFAQSLLPSGYKEKGWKSLLEIKYRAVDKKSGRVATDSGFGLYDLSFYRNHQESEPEISTSEQLQNETDKITNWYRSYGAEIDPFRVKAQLIIEQIQNEKFFAGKTDLKSKNDFMFKQINEFGKSMDDQEFLRFTSAMADFVDYNDNREAMIQEEGAALGVVTPFEQITKTRAGICGDIHGMVAKMAENRGWEAFTVGYALQSTQHVLTAMVNPNKPAELMIVNYGTYETQDLNNGNWINPTPSGEGFNEMGIQMRIFKNDDAKNPMGKMQQIATIPNALGSFMNDLFKKESQISKAMPSNQNYRIEKAGGEINRHQVNVKNSGNKITDKLAGEGLVIYEGETDNAQIYGVAVSHDVYKDIYRWDNEQKKCVLKKNKYFSLGVATSLVDQRDDAFNEIFYAYLNIKGGEILHVYQSEHFQFKGVIGYEFSAMGAMIDGKIKTADADLTGLFGVIADYKNQGTTIHTALTYETSVGLKNQNLMTDFSQMKSNVNPLNFNALSLDASLTHKISPKMSFVTDNNLTLTRVGGRVLLSTGIIHNNTTLMASYQGGFKPLKIGNTLQQVNLLQNFNDMDGVRLSVDQKFSSKNRAISGSFSAYGGVSTSTVKPIPMAGASLKLSLGGVKKKKNQQKD